MFLTSDNGIQIYTKIYRPDWASSTEQCHGLVLIPGGAQVGSIWETPELPCNAQRLAATGFIVAFFDCQGRGQSGGEEDMFGPIHRGDLRVVIEYLAGRPDVLPFGIGVVSSSWAITLAVPTLANFPDLNVRFLVDMEGSHNRYTSTQWDDPTWVANFGNHNTGADGFWSEREAITYQPWITVPYIRIQSDFDHAIDEFYVDHAIEMVNAAVTGLSPYARLNHEPANQILDIETPENYEWEFIGDIYELIYTYVVEASVTVFPGE